MICIKKKYKRYIHREQDKHNWDKEMVRNRPKKIEEEKKIDDKYRKGGCSGICIRLASWRSAVQILAKEKIFIIYF